MRGVAHRRTIVRVTHEGGFQGVPSTGNKVTITGQSARRVTVGKLAGLLVMA